MERAEKRADVKADVPTKFDLPTKLKGVACACDHLVNVKCAAGDEEALREMCGRKLCPDCEGGLKAAQKKWAKAAEGAGSSIEEEVEKAKNAEAGSDLWLPEHYKK